MLDSCDHPEQSSNEHGRVKASKIVHCSMKCSFRLTMAYDTNRCQHGGSVKFTFYSSESVTTILA